MQFLEILSLLQKRGISSAIFGISLLLQKRGLSYAISIYSFCSLKTWTTTCNFWNFIPFSRNVDYHIRFLEFFSKTWTIIWNFWIFFPSPKMWTVIFNLWNFFPFSKNVDYHMQFLEFLSLLQKL